MKTDSGFLLKTPPMLTYVEAYEEWKTARERWEAIQGARLGEEERALHQNMFASLSLLPGVYRHWKSQAHEAKFYVVREVRFEGNPVRPVVLYVPLYGESAGEVSHRDLLDAKEGFLAPVHRPDGPPFSYMGQRYRQQVPLSPGQVNTLCERARELVRVHDEHKLMLWVRELCF